jgi:hypothetical protein
MSDLNLSKETERILVRGLNAMTKACDSLTKQNDILNEDIQKLKAKLARLQDRIIVNEESKE